MSRRTCLLLIGPRGAGKTTVGRRVSELSGRRVMVTDDEVERLAGTSISELVRSKGWGEFRRMESETIAGLDGLTDTVVDLGGGAVMDPANRRVLSSIGRFVLLYAPEDVLARRIDEQGREARPPLFHGAGAEEEVARVLAERMLIFKELAELSIDTSKIDARAAALRLIEFMGWEGSE